MRGCQGAIWCVAALLLPACTSSTVIPDADREALTKDLNDRTRFLKLSFYQGPFWRDDTKLLLSDGPFEQVNLIDDTQGHPMSPGTATGILPAGRRVRITRVEFPTALVIAGRMVYTPRYDPWVYLTVDGQDPSRPSILVLPAGMTTREQFLAELSRYLVEDDPTSSLLALPEDVRKAIAEKRVLPGMSTDAVLMAWGYPTHKRIEQIGGLRSELWTYDDGKRTAAFEDGRLKGPPL